jgi:carboxypeptidase C (cathepsin A)
MATTSESPPSSIPQPRSFTQEFCGDFGGTTMRYRAVARETYISGENALPIASFFTIAYLQSDISNLASRPVTFIFNGGPGSSSQWLHMGALGPKRVLIPDAVSAGAPSYSVVDNPLSILEISDLVFIDPVGTGFSRPLGGKDLKHFCGLLEDARSIAQFIETWITANQRWNSPKYLIGESYGTVRASLLAEMLSDRYIALNGIVMIAGVLDYQNSRPRPGDGGILSYVSFLPSYAAAAWYHGKISQSGRTIETFLNEVRQFARSEYAQALIANFHRLSPSERAHLTSRLAALHCAFQATRSRGTLFQRTAARAGIGPRPTR